MSDKATALFEAGKLDEAIVALSETLRNDPANLRARTFLFELLCLAGDLDRADKHLDFLAKAGPEAHMAVLRAHTEVPPHHAKLLASLARRFRIALCSVQSHWDELIPLVRSGRLNPERFISHRMSLSDGAEAYRLFDAKEDGAMKMVMSG